MPLLAPVTSMTRLALLGLNLLRGTVAASADAIINNSDTSRRLRFDIFFLRLGKKIASFLLKVWVDLLHDGTLGRWRKGSAVRWPLIIIATTALFPRYIIH